MNLAEKEEEMKKRRKILVYPATQWRVIIWWVVLLTLFTVGISWLIFYLTWSSALEWTGKSLSSIGITEVFHKVIIGVSISLLGSVILGALVGTFAGLFITHKIVGPIYRLRGTLQDLKEGKSSGELKFREGDEFHDLAGEFNSFFRSFYDAQKIIENAKGKVEEFLKKEKIGKSELKEISQILEGGAKNEENKH